MQTDVYNQEASKIGTVELPETVFGVAMNPDLIAQVITAQAANRRQTTAHAKDRSEVRGGGKKPWRQKGTGRARHSSTRSPIWSGGGVTFGPTKERNFSKKINTKMRRRALHMALSSKVADKQYAVLDAFELSAPKSKDIALLVEAFAQVLPAYQKGKGTQDSVLLITPQKDRMVEKSAANIPYVKTLSAKTLSAKDILQSKYMIVCKDAVETIAATYKV